MRCLYLVHLTEEQILGIGEVSTMSFDASLLNTDVSCMDKSSVSVRKGSGQDKKPVHIHLSFVKTTATRCTLHGLTNTATFHPFLSRTDDACVRLKMRLQNARKQSNIG